MNIKSAITSCVEIAATAAVVTFGALAGVSGWIILAYAIARLLGIEVLPW